MVQDTLNSSLSDLIFVLLRAGALGLESALLGVELTPPIGWPPKDLERPAEAAGANRGPEPGAEDEVDLDQLVRDLEQRLTGISVDLAAVTGLWEEMDEEPRAALLDQLRYYGELHTFFAARGHSDRKADPSADAGGEQLTKATTAISKPKARQDKSRASAGGARNRKRR
jgi:hypothetical protein